MKRPLTVFFAAVALVGIAGPALAAWTTTGSGSGRAAARVLAAPTGLGTSAGSPSHTAINVTFTPGSNPAGTTYTVTRDKKKDGTAGPEVACSALAASPCSDTGLTPSTAYSYTVRAVLGNWSAQAAGSVSRTTAATPVAGPPAPATVTVASPCTGYVKNTSASVSISWSASAGALTYRLYVGTDSTTAPTTATQVGITGTSTSLTFSPSNNTAHYFWVDAVNASGSSTKTRAGQTVTVNPAGSGSCTVATA